QEEEGLGGKATSPLNKETDWESIKAFCEQLNNEFEGPQLATRLLAHKIQSPQEWEAMQALTVLETCMKNCGKRFHSEVGKFRFLNELIKVVSPKYLGTRAPEPVKKKVLEIMYSWTVGLPNETKISDAYQMLKKQGIVKQDPVLPDDKPLPPPPPRPKNAIFEDEEKSKMLSRLLNSTHPEDLRAANKLIKEMVQEDQKRMEKVSKRVNAIQEVKESVSLLTQLLADYNQDGGSQNNEELIKDLYQRCEKMRPTLFRLASDTEDNDEALAEILQANDSLTQVINLYRQRVKGEEVNGDGAATPQLTGKSTALLDLTGLDTSSPAAPSYPEAPIRPHGQPPLPQEVGISLLDDELMSLGLNEVSPSHPGDSTAWNCFQPAVAIPSQATPSSGSKALEELDLLGKALLQQSLPPESQQQQSQSKPTLRDLQHKSSTNPIPSGAFAASLSMILLPVTVFDRHSLRVLFHFAHDSPPSRPDVLVVVISMLSSAPVPVTNIRFQAAVPKVMKVKLQPPSGTELPAFNPILPPAAITQVLLLANPSKEKVRLRYKLTFTLGEESHDETGDVEQFPPPDTWGNL
uniref:Golgi associated, gamma adaptin ear containing, ARF binding protein 1 n=1 Tax=Scleropages formosus TaxID=113540 RepID=A0A8C9W2G2_SCLFO